MSHLTLTEVLELVQDDDDASEAESEGDELSGAEFLGNGGDCDREHELLRIVLNFIILDIVCNFPLPHTS